MINQKQAERLSAKVSRLKNIYERYLVQTRTALSVSVGKRTGRKIACGEVWGKDFCCTDFYATLPALPREAYLEVDSGGTESLIEIDGVPVGMVDWVRNAQDPASRPHRYFRLCGVKAGASLRVQSYASHPIAGTQPYHTETTFSLNTLEKERVFRGIYIVTLRKDVKDFLENLGFFESLIKAAPEDDWLRCEAYRVYEELFCILSMSEEEPEDLGAANAVFDKFFSALPAKREKPYFGLVGHSHLDTAWLWTVDETRRKAMRTAANAVEQLSRYPDYRFIMSSVLHLDWLLQDSPALFERITELVKEGRFEPNGATWVECDCNLTGGEAMVRHFLRGKRFLRQYFGYEADTFWLPDTFGYSAALPQIMRGCNVKYFLTTKLSWNDTNEFPYESFVWRGIDGSDVLVHFNTTHSEADPAFLARRLKNAKNRRLQEDMLIAYGYGDGGGGPSEDMVRRALKTEKLYPWARAEHTSVSAFMHRLENKELPKYHGELYLELHRGTLSSMHGIKQNNRKLETALRDAEFLSVAAGLNQWKKKTDAAYDTLMLNQFHDILPGTCIDEVNVRSLEETGGAIKTLETLMRGKGKAQYYNTLSFAREETLESEEGASYTDFDGKNHTLARYRFAPFARGEKIESKGRITYRGGVVTTPYLTATVKEGVITSLIVGGRETAAGSLGEVRCGENIPYQWDNWDIDADYPLKERRAQYLSGEVIEADGLQLRVRSVFALGKKSTLTRDIVFDAFTSEIRFENKLDYNEDRSLVRVYFPTNLVSSTVKSEIQFGYIERSTYRNTSRTQAQFEVCNHRYSDLSETNFGMALLNDCKYGFACEEGTMSLTLMKSGVHPDKSGDKGVKYFTYSLLPHEGGFSAKNVVQPALRLNNAPVLTAYKPVSPVTEISADGVIMETLKHSEDGKGVIVRLYESERARTKATVRFNKAYRITETNLLEDEIESLGTGEEITLEFKPFEIKTLLLAEAE